MGYRYIGNKSRLADQIYSIIGQFLDPGDTVADPMCGTGAISAKLRSKGHRVVAGDLMSYSVHHARTRLLFDEPPKFKGLGLDYREILFFLNNEVEPIEGLFFKEYSPDGYPVSGTEPRKYFSPHNAKLIDGILLQLKEWRSLMTEDEQSVLRHDLIMAVNSVSNIAGTYGHYRSTFSAAALKKMILKPSSFEPGRTDHVVTRGPAAETLKNFAAEAVYLDPPYKKRQYAANYHILETLARGDNPIPVGVSGLRDWWPEYSDFCSKVRIEGAFHELFRVSDAKLFFISYSEDGLIPDHKMRSILGQHGKLTRFDILHQRFKSNAGGAGGSLKEFLYIIDRR